MGYGYNPALTSYAKLIAPDLSSKAVEFIAPTVRVAATIGHYKAYNDAQAFQKRDTNRAIGGKATRIIVDSTDPTYSCTPHALEYPIDRHQLTQAGAGDPLGQVQVGIQTLLSNAAIAEEDDVFTEIAAGVSAVGGIGVWTNNSNDPIVELNGQIKAIVTATGRMPNRCLMGIDAYEAFVNNSNIKNFFPGAPIITTEMMKNAALTINPQLEIMVTALPKDTVKMGGTASNSQIVGAEVYLFYASPQPNLMDSSFAKTFRGGEGGIEQVRSYYEDQTRSDIYAIDWSRDFKITSSLSVKRISIT